MAVKEGNSKARYNGQGKMNFGQGKVSEKSVNFISDYEWVPCRLYCYICCFCLIFSFI